ncbi:aspartate kinase I [[Clostridium] sordellii]|uniref:Aspartokinase n=1 Tax=Paraclostridium sordellii TaxID=1505 RepID=A0ABM9RLE0_PARSO|nr:aspartate kinase [Paeniclostridium sordellii]CEJ72805.1 Aspartokinase 1 (Aspartokinase I) (1spartate kinase I) [[Clostridium] sordellii] [Paeniclostridium sordellii]CEN68358.1 aspartate kinase I [[Clostridium] sordellii] [Paeniclostridium sordellii]CEN71625.1 aspartate kinase I [[Clostridium] sordellii] [Paeniclostridium sordellii]CEO21937.1 aspartate kinase I [[Clostridium] sordellii] [Paeniclostridium sordellii]CEP76782.1 aspartate kinase I [[Clostridium] sordellii] [Paeniclostridium sord
MTIVVQKFGGTSVESNEKMQQVCSIIKNYKEKGLDLVVVVSAMGRKGAPYATDTLLNLCKDVNENSSKRELDLIMSCGEIISGTILTNMLNGYGIDSIFLTGSQAGIYTDGQFSDSRIVDIKPDRISKELSKGKVVIIAGFQGVTEDGEVTTLGRGGSDTSAVAIGKALGCENVEIYTDVDGIMTADPRVEPEAKVLEYINYEEVFQMADKGAKVIHPRAVEIAKSGSITLSIKNTLNPEYPGTRISGRCPKFEVNEDDACLNTMTAVAHKNGIAQIKIKSREDIFTEIMNDIEKNEISLDMINFFIEEKAFVIEHDKLNSLIEILKAHNLDYKIKENCAKVTLIGSKMTGIPGVMTKIVRALSKSKINLLQTSDSNMTISCLVEEKDMKNAVHAIHEEFKLN